MRVEITQMVEDDTVTRVEEEIIENGDLIISDQTLEDHHDDVVPETTEGWQISRLITLLILDTLRGSSHEEFAPYSSPSSFVDEQDATFEKGQMRNMDEEEMNIVDEDLPDRTKGLNTYPSTISPNFYRSLAH